MNDEPHDTDSSRPYVLGHSDREIERLKAQARLVDPMTERFFRDAGLEPSMRVLDIGSGAGDVAFVAAKIVGASGEVVGVDRAASAVAIARDRAVEKAMTNVTFKEGDPGDMVFEQPFDAVIGRYVLQFQKDPAAMLRKLAAHLRPGGLVVFQEIDWGGLGSSPAVPTFERCAEWGRKALGKHGTESRMGTRLHAAFVSAGLPPPTMRLEAQIGGVPAIVPWLNRFKELIATLLPEIERHGIATAEEIDIDTLGQRMADEARALSSVVISHYQICAWTRLVAG